MPNTEFIHSCADVSSTLIFALDSGLQIMIDEPQSEPEPRMLTRAHAAQTKSGVFSLIHPEWIFGLFQKMAIPSGFNQGKYFFQPRTNHTAVSIYFSGERIDQGRR